MMIDVTTSLRNRLVRAYALWLASKNWNVEYAISHAKEYEAYINGEEKEVKTVDHDNGRLV